MKATVISKSATSVTISVTIPLGSSMLEGEGIIQEAVNRVGSEATIELFSRFDTDGSPIRIGGTKYTSKGQVEKTYQSPYGSIRVARHVYQGSDGGATYCPLEVNARTLGTSTPKFAMQLSSKYSRMGVTQVQGDLEENHGRSITKVMIQSVSERVANAIESKQDYWTYDDTADSESVASVSIGMDGTCILMAEDGWRETMVGTIALFDSDGNRLHTSYLGAPPEYGKESFLERMDREIEMVANKYPNAIRIGIADGARCNWPYLSQHTERQTLDFWHAAEYVNKASKAIFPDIEARQKAWARLYCHKLKHNITGATILLNEMRTQAKQVKGRRERKSLATAISYFRNNRQRMNYAENLQNNLPIGSGITEAACKTIVKQRFCQSGMRWKEIGAETVLRLRTMVQTTGRWTQFWAKISQFGVPATC